MNPSTSRFVEIFKSKTGQTWIITVDPFGQIIPQQVEDNFIEYKVTENND